MIYRFWTTASAAALCTAFLVSGPALADSQLRSSVSDQLNQHNITVADFDKLSDTEVSQIALILNINASVSETDALIKGVLAKNATCVGNDQLRKSVENQLREHKIVVKNYEKISGSELVVLETILNSQESNVSKRSQIDRIFATVTPTVAGSYLRIDVENCIKGLNVEVDLDTLTPDQLMQIQLIAGGSDSANSKREMIEKIAAQK